MLDSASERAGMVNPADPFLVGSGRATATSNAVGTTAHAAAAAAEVASQRAAPLDPAAVAELLGALQALLADGEVGVAGACLAGLLQVDRPLSAEAVRWAIDWISDVSAKGGKGKGV